MQNDAPVALPEPKALEGIEAMRTEPPPKCEADRTHIKQVPLEYISLTPEKMRSFAHLTRFSYLFAQTPF